VEGFIDEGFAVDGFEEGFNEGPNVDGL